MLPIQQDQFSFPLLIIAWGGSEPALVHPFYQYTPTFYPHNFCYYHPSNCSTKCCFYLDASLNKHALEMCQKVRVRPHT